jgi:hypothetical protein
LTEEQKTKIQNENSKLWSWIDIYLLFVKIDTCDTLFIVILNWKDFMSLLYHLSIHFC